MTCPTRRILLRAILTSLPAFVGGAEASAGRPNVIIVLTDDQGYGDLSCHGNPALRTPHLDRLHAQSIRLIDFHVAPVCTPTRGQLLTGPQTNPYTPMYNNRGVWTFGQFRGRSQSIR